MRRRRPGNQVAMSLFPFLAVLICTMGALILLLVMVVEQARVYAATETPVVDTPDPELEAQQRRRQQERHQQEMDRDEQVWRQGILKQQRDEKTAELAGSRLQLGHLERHINELEQRWRQLQAEVQQIQTDNVTPDSSQLQHLLQAREQLEEKIRQRQLQRTQQPTSYAILPYEGPNKTRRRPIYLECSERGITLQPCGVTLTNADLEGPSGPGNPLDAALRTIREYWRETGVLLRSDPYPLLLVRPDGVESYGAARGSLASWDDEFGYELVGADMPLAFPPVDPELNARVEKAVQLAKERQKLLATAMPQAFGDSSRQIGAMRASASGGFVPVGGGDAELQAQAERMLAGQEAATFGGQGSGAANAHSATNPGQRGAEGEASGGDTGATNGTADGAGANGSGAGEEQSLASARGANWALLKHTPGATGWTRPIRVLCLHDRLVVMPESNSGQEPKTVATHGLLRDKMDAFAELVRKHVEGWGIAPARGYWKPMLQIEVGPQGEAIFHQLQTLLDNSGFEVRKARP